MAVVAQTVAEPGSQPAAAPGSDPYRGEFGETRPVETLKANHGRPTASILSEVVKAVQEFSAGEQSDDLTWVIAKGLQ